MLAGSSSLPMRTTSSESSSAACRVWERSPMTKSAQKMLYYICQIFCKISGQKQRTKVGSKICPLSDGCCRPPKAPTWQATSCLLAPTAGGPKAPPFKTRRMWPRALSPFCPKEPLLMVGHIKILDLIMTNWGSYEYLACDTMIDESNTNTTNKGN